MSRVLTTHVGSLVRPPELVRFLRQIDEGHGVDPTEFEACLRESVAKVVRQQADAGIDIVSDGEFGKMSSWSRYMRERLSGFDERYTSSEARGKPREVVPAGTDRHLFPAFYAEYDRTQGFTGPSNDWVCVGPIQYAGRDVLRRDIEVLRAAVDDVDVVGGFMPAVAPASIVPVRLDEYGRRRAE